MKLYNGKNVENFAVAELSKYFSIPVSNLIIPTGNSKNKPYGVNIAKNVIQYIQDMNTTAVDIILKPKIDSSVKNKSLGGEPKSDIVVVLANDYRMRISIKKDTKNSGIVNITSNSSYDIFLTYVKKYIPDLYNEAYEFKDYIGTFSLTDVKHAERFKKEMNNPKHKVPNKLKPILLDMFESAKNTHQYDEYITNSQEKFRILLRKMITENTEGYLKLLTEYITGADMFGDQDATANIIVTVDGVYTPAEYAKIHTAAKLSRGKEIGRIRKTPRASAYNAKKDDINKLFSRLTNVSAAITF